MVAQVDFVQDTLTLKLPTLEDLVKAVATATPGTQFNLNYHKFDGKVTSGMALTRIPGTRTMMHKTWVINTDNITIQDGTIDLLSKHHYALLITGKNVMLKNVTIVGLGHKGLRHANPYLIRVAEGGSLTLNQCIIECESVQPHAILVDTGATCNISSTRIYGGGVGNALKVCGGTVNIHKRSLLQGGVVVTSPQEAKQPAARLKQAAASGVLPLPGTVPDMFEQALKQAAAAADQQAEDRPLSPSRAQPASTSIKISQSRLEIRNSEVLAGPAACLAVHGASSTVLCDSCHLGGACTLAVLASHSASVDLMACEISGCTFAGVVLAGSGHMTATNTSISGGRLGIRTTTGATANLVSCTITSVAAPTGEPARLPTPPKPGMLPDFRPAAPSPAESRGRGSAVKAKDCMFGAPGVKGWRAVCGGQVAVEEGLMDGLKPFQQLNYKV